MSFKGQHVVIIGASADAARSLAAHLLAAGR
jgi:NAD(P)-dependent dehydrogenase (short-subunit alcohol dehydrogenase family)